MRGNEQARHLGKPLHAPDHIAEIVGLDLIEREGFHEIANQFGPPLLIAGRSRNGGNLFCQGKHARSELLRNPKQRGSDISVHDRSKLSAPRHSVTFHLMLDNQPTRFVGQASISDGL
jgi:hypothetical protein